MEDLIIASFNTLKKVSLLKEALNLSFGSEGVELGPSGEDTGSLV